MSKTITIDLAERETLMDALRRVYPAATWEVAASHVHDMRTGRHATHALAHGAIPGEGIATVGIAGWADAMPPGASTFLRGPDEPCGAGMYAFTLRGGWAS
jgi:hypothetical protein